MADAELERDPASYRDPAGFVYRRDGVLHRQIDRSFAAEWDALAADGLLARLQAEGLLIPHEPAPPDTAADPATAHAVIRPEPVDFISYPYEWSFGQLKDAALLTLRAEERAVAAGFTLRDATAYNVQFQAGRPILIDTLSFGRLEPGKPWIAYRQFCEHFLAPLALMARRDVRLSRSLREHLDGVPLDLAARLLPARTRLNVGLLSHVHLHARAQRRHAGRGEAAAADARRRQISPMARAALLDSLRRTVERLDWRAEGTEWAEYAEQEHTSYQAEAARRKDEIVGRFVAAAPGQTVWDMGANTGRFSRIAAGLGRRVVAWDVDPAATERHYRAVRAAGETRILPLLQDLADPSPALGWGGSERRSLWDRADANVVLALALVHHLAISRNVPLPMLADVLARLAPQAVVEWVPKDDPMVQRLLATREDIFPDYSEAGFRAAVERRFEIAEVERIEGSPRSLFRLVRR